MEDYRSIPDSELTYGKDCPYIDIQWEKGRIFISNAVFRLIGKPSGIRFLWNAGKRSIIIEPTSIDDPDGFPVIGATYAKYGSLQIGCSTLIREIWPVVDWDKTLRFRIVPKYNEQSNVAIFELKDAIASEIPRNRRGGRPQKPPKTESK
ncbi:hypothetical protein D0T84_17790 [Dysgonomonas sp. 521]|uniref:hypothetical protein n=1 Tax=Dysgonomonas sp. 521 TaxID=2302932 RepID=UPI0013D040B6|nr:hypothetical protein [Dysgonomonas sp. 521]NDV96748.1 hypothetical protein [Dysgonomonas sp. 521]